MKHEFWIWLADGVHRLLEYVSISFERSKITWDYHGSLTFIEILKFIPKPELNVRPYYIFKGSVKDMDLIEQIHRLQ